MDKFVVDPELTHKKLCELAGYYLSVTLHCSVVLIERKGISEEPDAIGWRNSTSHMIECKVSRSDFLADDNKPHRQRGGINGMGMFKYYMCPHGLIQPDEIPDKWGLIWTNGQSFMSRIKKKPVDFDVPSEAMHKEINMLTKALRQVRIGAILIPDTEEYTKKIKADY